METVSTWVELSKKKKKTMNAYGSKNLIDKNGKQIFTRLQYTIFAKKKKKIP